MWPLRAVPVLLCLAQPLVAQSPTGEQPVVRGWEAVAFLGITAGAMVIDQSVRHLLKRNPDQLPSAVVRAGDLLGTARYMGPAVLAGVLTGIAASDTSVEAVSTRAFESLALSGAAALVLKTAIGRKRPDLPPNTPFTYHPFTIHGNSLPSGRTAIAFAVATSLASETRDHWSDALFYSIATLTAFSRINDDKHWLSDTLMGAALGIVSARLVRHWHHNSSTATPLVALHLTF